MAVDGSASLEILRFTQDDIVGVVILNSHPVILNSHYVILNAVKNLEVSVAVDGSASLEILRFTQDDIVLVVLYKPVACKVNAMRVL